MSGPSSSLSKSLTAKFLLERINKLRDDLIRRYANLLDAAYESSPAPPDAENQAPPPALTDTAVKQLQLDVETTQLVHTIEEFMRLTRAMKEVWVFGDLDTISPSAGTDDARARKMEEDERFVVESMKKYLAGIGSELLNDKPVEDKVE